MDSFSAPEKSWRLIVLGVFVVGSLGVFFALAPIPQDPSHNLFADGRFGLGIPNVANVLSNLPFLVVGILGVSVVLRAPRSQLSPGWLVLFVAVSLVALGSAYYHWSPGNESLVWDRLPLTVGFMGFFASLTGEYFGPRVTRVSLVPAILVGIASVLYWYVADDLRFYIWVQYMPLSVILLSLILFKSRYSHSYLLTVALVWYLAGKFFEGNDAAVYRWTDEIVSGHSIKHIFAAAACYTLVVYFGKRVLKP